MKLIHCADFHLNSPLAQLPADKAALRRNELLHTFGRLAAYAAQNDVRAVLISGDLFDASYVPRKTADYILSIISGCPAVSFYYLRGNHDADFVFSAGVPDNLHLFGPEWRYYTCGDVTISGIEPAAGMNRSDSLRLDPSACNIVMLHGQSGAAEETCPIALSALRDRAVDYLALGHIHAYRQGRLDARGVWAYPGCPEGRGFDECGEKGVILLNVDSGVIKPEFVPFAQRTGHAVSVDLTGLSDLSEQQGAVRNALIGIPDSDGVYLTLTGRCAPETVPDDAFWISALQNRFFQFRLQNEIQPLIDATRYQSEISLKGAFFRNVMQADLPESERNAILQLGFAALDGELNSTQAGEDHAIIGSLY